MLGAVLTAVDKQRAWVSIGCVAAVVNIGANLVAIPWCVRHLQNGAIGAALVTVVTEFVVMAGAARLRPRGVFDRSVLFYCVRCALACALMVPAVLSISGAWVGYKVLVGAAVFGAGSMILRVATLSEIRRQITEVVGSFSKVESVATEGVADPAFATETTPATAAPPVAIVVEAPSAMIGAEGPGLAAHAPLVRIRFESVSSEIVGDSKVSVDQLIAYLDAHPDVVIKVVGHADRGGTRLANLAISRARTDALVSSLVGAGIDRGRISASAQGDRLPVESNTTAEGRLANCRVDVVLFGGTGADDRHVAEQRGPTST